MGDNVRSLLVHVATFIFYSDSYNAFYQIFYPFFKPKIEYACGNIGYAFQNLDLRVFSEFYACYLIKNINISSVLLIFIFIKYL